MKIISRKVHGIIDYLMGVFLIAMPWIFNFNNSGYASSIPIILGMGTIIYSLFTNYELGVFKTISMRIHLIVDFMAGFVLSISPWLFGFSDVVYWPHLIIGLGEMLVAFSTDASPPNQFTGNNNVDWHS